MAAVWSPRSAAISTRFWSEPDRARQIVVITDDHPDTNLRGLFGEVVDEVADGPTYLVAISSGHGFKIRTRAFEIPWRYLRPMGQRLRPEPVPRPVRTSHPGRDPENLRPAHDFEIVDELDQYL